MDTLPARYVGRLLARTEPARHIDYDPVTAPLGFPSELEAELRSRGIITGEGRSCFAESSVDYAGPYDGWWCSEKALVVIEDAVADALSEHWRATCEIHHFSGTRKETRWPLAPSSATAPSDSVPSTPTSDPLEVFPSAMVAPVRGGRVHAWWVARGRRIDEHVAAYRLFEGSVTVFDAYRSARSEQALAGTSWSIQLIEGTEHLVELVSLTDKRASRVDPHDERRTARPALLGARAQQG